MKKIIEQLTTGVGIAYVILVVSLLYIISENANTKKELLAQIVDADNQIVDAETQINKLELYTDELDQQLGLYLSTISELNDTVSELNATISELNTDNESLQSTIKGLEEDIRTALFTIQDLEIAIAELDSRMNEEIITTETEENSETNDTSTDTQ